MSKAGTATISGRQEKNAFRPGTLVTDQTGDMGYSPQASSTIQTVETGYRSARVSIPPYAFAVTSAERSAADVGRASRMSVLAHSTRSRTFTMSTPRMTSSRR